MGPTLDENYMKVVTAVQVSDKKKRKRAPKVGDLDGMKRGLKDNKRKRGPRAPTAYLLFSQEKRKEMGASLPSGKGEAMKTLGALWTAATEEEKAKFVVVAIARFVVLNILVNILLSALGTREWQKKQKSNLTKKEPRNMQNKHFWSTLIAVNIRQPEKRTQKTLLPPRLNIQVLFFLQP